MSARDEKCKACTECVEGLQAMTAPYMKRTLGPKTVEEFQEALQELEDGDSSVYWLLSQAAQKVQQNRDCVLAAVKKNGLALDVASRECKADKDVVLAAVKQDSDAFSYVDKFNKMWKDKDFVLKMVKMQGSALQFAHPPLPADKDVVMAAISNKGSALQYADETFKANKDVALEAVTNESDAFSYVDKKGVMWKDKAFVLPMVKLQGSKALEFVDKAADMWKDDDFVLKMVEMQGNALKFVDAKLKGDKNVVAAAVKERSDALEFVDKNATFWNDREAVYNLVKSTGRALEFAASYIKADRDVVLAAVTTTPTSLHFATGDWSKDIEIMEASGQVRSEQQNYEEKEQAILSVGSHNKDYATNFAVLLRRNPYFRKFKTCNPKAVREISCDSDPMNITSPCRGTPGTCSFMETQNAIIEEPNNERSPSKKSCWRFGFRYYLEECRASKGFMIQVQDKRGLDDGQRIETEMAQQADVKIFRTMTTSEDVDNQQITKLQNALEDWFKKGCRNHYMVELQLR